MKKQPPVIRSWPKDWPYVQFDDKLQCTAVLGVCACGDFHSPGDFTLEQGYVHHKGHRVPYMNIKCVSGHIGCAGPGTPKHINLTLRASTPLELLHGVMVCCGNKISQMKACSCYFSIKELARRVDL